jgi:hypothetical protein
MVSDTIGKSKNTHEWRSKRKWATEFGESKLNAGVKGFADRLPSNW